MGGVSSKVNRVIRTLTLTLAVFSQFGCVAIAFEAIGALASGIGIYQRYEDRQAQKDQTEAIREQSEEIKLLRRNLEERFPVLLGGPDDK